MLWECVLSVIPTNKCHILLSYVYFSIWDIYTFKTNQTPRSALLSSYQIQAFTPVSLSASLSGECLRFKTQQGAHLRSPKLLSLQTLL